MALNFKKVAEVRKQQRQVIEDQLTQATAANNAYPRSMTMRFLTQKPGLMLLAEVSTFVLGIKNRTLLR
jgi:hypothetical protein